MRKIPTAMGAVILLVLLCSCLNVFAKEGETTVNNKRSETLQIIEEGQRELQQAEEFGDKAKIAQACIKIARAKIRMVEHEEAKQLLEKTLLIAEQGNLSKIRGEALSNLSVIYLYQGIYDVALELSLEAADIFMALSDSIMLSKEYANLGRANYNLGYYDKAIAYYEQGIVLKGSQDPQGLIFMLNHYAKTLLAKGDTIAARQKALAALTMSQQADFERGLGYTYHILGLIALKDGDYPNAQMHFRQATKSYVKTGDINSTALSLKDSGTAALYLKDYDQAQQLLSEALKISLKSHKLTDAGEIQSQLASIAEIQGNLPGALNYMKNAMKDYREGFDLQVYQAATAQQSRRELSAKQKEIELLKQRTELQQLLARRAQFHSFVLAVGFAGVVLLSVVLYREAIGRKRKEAELLQVAAQLEVANTQLMLLATTDTLTGLNNRRGFDVKYQEMFLTAAEDHSLAVIMIDIDSFKPYNDIYGHIAGDECLRQISSILQTWIQPPALIARFGGEEFAAVIPGSIDVTIRTINAIMKEIANLGMEHKGVPGGQVTVSAGIAYKADWPEATTMFLLSQADSELYLAKDSGRNAVFYQGKARLI